MLILKFSMFCLFDRLWGSNCQVSNYFSNILVKNLLFVVEAVYKSKLNGTFFFRCTEPET